MTLALAARDVCHCRRPRISGRRYYGFSACVLCDLLIVSAWRRRRLDSIERAGLKRNVIAQPKFWQRHIERLEEEEVRNQGSER